ncbi:integrase catalytic domain-containing protein [Trichonephila clavipes]|uniref:Integrase catalytic domain-containing protein n=1 Tax=Trichonephila clavipes TaxID=2585209 RepID=A0A8X6R2T2_TRICX|nr:integrase catalytic domain-containing protein [Trichonephila clavipes]
MKRSKKSITAFPKKKEFQKVEASIYEVDDDIQKLEIDVLLDAELFFSFLNNDKIKIAEHLFLQSSVFGYLVSGVVSDNNFYNTPKNCFSTKNLDILDKTLKRFWEIEEVETTEVCSDELKYCNDHFEKTHLRKPDGKFVVEMPFKPDSSEGILGNSKAIASKRLDQLWTRLERDPTMQTLYSEFLNEYELLQHMEEVKEDSDVKNGYYLPHHGVLRLSSKTTRLRVVFNASAKTSSGLSLKDLLCKGGVFQEDLFSILIRFRKYAYAFTADIRQMFRMIEVNLLWKNNKIAPTKVYELKTVTYGTASAPYLATRVLQQLALDEKRDFPLASEVLLQDFYMDDCLSGASELSEFEKLKSELTQLLQRGGMTLHKWCSNKAPSTELREFSLDHSSEEVVVKTLGMLWDTSDSTIALAWINSPSNLLKTFVSNRVFQIQQLSRDFQWQHVPSELNSTDLISRGLDVKTLATSELWFKGLEFSKLSLPSHRTEQNSSDLTHQFYINELKPVFKNSKSTVKETGFLKQREYADAEKSLLKRVQVKYFTTEIAAIKREMSVPSTSKLRFLNPFIDKSEGLIRVGGKLAHSNLNFNQKHPIILPNGNKLVKLIFQYYNKRDFHVGPQALLNTVRLKYWPIGGRNVARKVAHECVECFRNKIVVVTQIMGDLPAERVTSSSTFLNVGIDLCGPFEIKYMGQRKGTFQKIYVALFVCMATQRLCT